MKIFVWSMLTLGTACLVAGAQQGPSGTSALTPETLDPTRAISAAPLEGAHHHPLPEQYIWTKEDAVPEHPPFSSPTDRKGDLHPHFFRRSFQLKTVPHEATLYIAGPRAATIYVNGDAVRTEQLNLDLPLGSRVLAVNIASALREGSNVIAIEAIRGKEINSGADSRLSVQQTRGKVLVVKLTPAAQGVDAEPLLISDTQWKASTAAPQGWQAGSFNDANWTAADSLGGIESSIEFFQWNADAGLYDWPGYDGISPFLAQYVLKPVAVSHIYAGRGQIDGAQTLQTTGSNANLRVQLPEANLDASDAPQIMLDFGREVVGRLSLTSASPTPSDVLVQYGESEAELFHQPYLGIDPLHISASGTAYGPKSAFRYALVRFVHGRDTRFSAIHLAGINYPVAYQGSFQSSDEILNRMWATGAYTAHLCMQDDIWDAPKRDRGRWMGDLDVSGRTIEDAFGDHFLMEHTLDRLLGESPVRSNVNGIAGYSAFWVTGEAEYYRHTGSREQLASIHDRLLQLLHLMDGELNEQNLYSNKTHSWPFVDWSPDLNGDTPEARRATQLEFYAAYRDGAFLLDELGDTQNAETLRQRAAALKAAAQQHLLDPSGSFGDRWQTNAMAILSGVADPAQYNAIWHNSLSTVGKTKDNALIITPYYNYYVISAMAKLGHRAEALNWIRQYWGGMLAEGATSFWEGYDPSWYKDDFHASLQADNMSGYRVSLAHGWSSGITPWLMEEVLGIHARAAGFREVDLRPDLLDLDWAKGGEPTPRGMLTIALSKASRFQAVVDLPPGTTAHVSMPLSNKGSSVLVNGQPSPTTAAEDGSRGIVTLNTPGHYTLTTR